MLKRIALRLRGAVVLMVILAMTGFIAEPVVFAGDTEGEEVMFERLPARELPSLKEIYKDYFMIGTAFMPFDLTDDRVEVITRHFTAQTAENDMKPAYVQPKKGEFNYAGAEKIMEFSKENNMTMIGHTLSWHSQSPDWMFKDPQTGEPLSREEAIENLTTHIKTVLAYYGDSVYSWDVVNEAIDENMKDGDYKTALRKKDSGWYKAIGDDWVEIAFQAAMETVDELGLSCKLYYNDYGLDSPGRRNAVYEMVKALREKGIRVDGIGMQAHYSTGTSAEQVEETIKKFSELYDEYGVLISITELDVGVDGSKGQKELTVWQELEQGIKYARLFRVFKKYSKCIERVTFWGMDDKRSWRAENFPLILDMNLNAKPAYYAVADPEAFLAQYDPDPEICTGTANYGTPVIDGETDKIWDSAEAFNIEKYIQKRSGASAAVKVLWDNDYLYTLFEVKTDTMNAMPLRKNWQDSVEIYISEDGHKTPGMDTYLDGDRMYRINFKNEQSFWKDTDAEGFISEARVVEGGYIVEAAVPLKKIKPENGVTIGFDAQLNNSDSGSGESSARWSDWSETAYTSTERWGDLLLTGKTDEAEKAVNAVNNDTVESVQSDTPQEADVKTNDENGKSFPNNVAIITVVAIIAVAVIAIARIIIYIRKMSKMNKK